MDVGSVVAECVTAANFSVQCECVSGSHLKSKILKPAFKYHAGNLTAILVRNLGLKQLLDVFLKGIGCLSDVRTYDLFYYGFPLLTLNFF